MYARACEGGGIWLSDPRCHQTVSDKHPQSSTTRGELSPVVVESFVQKGRQFYRRRRAFPILQRSTPPRHQPNAPRPFVMRIFSCRLDVSPAKFISSTLTSTQGRPWITAGRRAVSRISFQSKAPRSAMAVFHTIIHGLLRP